MTAAPPSSPAGGGVPARARWRRFALGLRALAGRGGGYVIPARLAPPGTQAPPPPYDAAERLFADAWPGMAGILAAVEAHADALLAIGQAEPPAPRWTQDWFPRLDAAVAYAMVRRCRPGRIVEIGSGHSTRFLARAIKDGGLTTRLTAIDPAPRAALGGLAIEWVSQPVQAAGHAPFAGLGAGDMVFIDSSHVMMPGSDVDHLVNRVLPMLASGVLVHVHDVFLPDAYPEAWTWRGYNEQQGILPLLTGGGYGILFASHYALTRHPAAIGQGVLGRLPLKEGARESSLWLVKRAAPIAP